MEIKINKPTKYADSAIFRKETGFEYFINADEYFLSGNATEKQLLDAFAAHNPVVPTEPTLDEKLASVGLSVADLKAALGL
jgi:hypothetical protein